VNGCASLNRFVLRFNVWCLEVYLAAAGGCLVGLVFGCVGCFVCGRPVVASGTPLSLPYLSLLETDFVYVRLFFSQIVTDSA
jgi:hypothetical protein